MRKKATEYSLWLVFITAILVFTVIIMLWGKFSVYDEKVGTTQFSLMDAYEKAEGVQHYIDFSSKLAFMESLYDGANTGFLYDWICDAEFPTYYGYKLLNSRSKNCVPNVKGTVSFRLINLLKEYTGVFPNDGIPYPIYNFYFFEDEPGFNLYGRYQKGLKLEINDEQELLLSESTYRLRNKVEISGDDSIANSQGISFSGACGETLVEIAEQGLGHPYCMAAGEWSPERLPPDKGKCPPLAVENEYCTEEDWKQAVDNSGKCPVDCGSFTKWVYNFYAEKTGDDSFHINARYATSQANNIGKPVDHDPREDHDEWETIFPNCDKLQKGDLIFFANTYDTDYTISHVGIYYGDCQFIHAGSPVKIKSLEIEHWKKHYIGAKRVCADEVVDTDNQNLISGAVVSDIEDEIVFEEFEFIPKADEGEIYEQFKSCEETGGQLCNDSQDCFGTQIMSADSGVCCLGECKHEFEARETLSELLPEEIDEEVKVYDVVIQEPEKSYETLIIVLVLIFVILGIIYYIKRNKLIVISLFAVLILSAGLFILVPDNNKITGKLTYDDLRDQQKNVCQVANAYGIPGTILLAIAQKESGGEHYKNGAVKISDDKGVGIMQITSRKDCGNSEIDGHKLDIYKVNDNIECGAIILLEKCDIRNCRNPSLSKEYDCPNIEFSSLSPKHVVYSGWDMAIRYYNGWGCEAPGYAHLAPAKYEKILGRVQSYVEDFHTTAVQFKGACPGDIEWNPSNTESADEVTTVLDLEALSQLMSETDTGYYFLNPEINEKFDFDFSEIHNDLAFASSQLITDVKDCAFEDYTCHGKLPSGVICYDINGVSLSCDYEDQTLDCYLSTDYSTLIDGEYVCELEFNQPTCLDQDNNHQPCKKDGQELECRDLTVTYRECVLEVLDNHDKSDWNLDYCKNNILEKNCYDSGDIWNGISCIEKPDDYDEAQTFKFCIDTDAEAFVYEDEAYVTRPVDVKFALTMHTGGARQQSIMEYDTFEDIVIPEVSMSGGSGETYHGTYMEIFESVKQDMGGTYNLYTDPECTVDLSAWCWVHSGCNGMGIYCKQNKLASASIATLNTLFRHEITHNLQHNNGRCGGAVSKGLGIRSEWGAEYYSGSTYYRFMLKGQSLTAQQLAEVMKQNGCSETLLMNAAFCKGGAHAKLKSAGCVLGKNGDIAEDIK